MNKTESLKAMVDIADRQKEISASLLKKLHEVADLVDDIPNDQELGAAVRKLFK